MNEPTREQKAEAGRLLGRLKAHFNIMHTTMSSRVARAQTAEEMEACLKRMRPVVTELDFAKEKGRETFC